MAIGYKKNEPMDYLLDMQDQDQKNIFDTSPAKLHQLHLDQLEEINQDFNKLLLVCNIIRICQEISNLKLDQKTIM